MTNTSKTAKPSGTKIVFFGSGPVASESLRRLAQEFEIEAIITKPSTTREMASAVESARIFTVENRQELDAMIGEKPFDSELGVLIDFGIIVSQKVIDYFPKGIINSHFSLLPEWRGADPITFSVLSGQKKTGVSLMLLTAGMDEGPIIAYGEQELTEVVTTPELTSSLIALSDALLKHDLPRYLSGEAKGIPQEKASELIGRSPLQTYSRKLTKQDGRINWGKPASVLGREIRAFTGWPRSQAKLKSLEAIITEVEVVKLPNHAKPGDVLIEKNRLFVCTGQDFLEIKRLQVPGKKGMTTEAFLAGYRSKL